MRVRGHLRPTIAVVRRDLLLAWSYRLQFLTGVFSGFITLTIFYYVSRLVQLDQFTSDEYFAFVAVGIVIFTVVNATLQIPQTSLRQELVAGTFERMVLAPWGSTPAIVSLLIFPTFYAFVTAFGLVCIGAAVFNLQLQWSTVALAVPVAILSLMAFAPFGVAILASMVFSKKAPPGAGYVVAVLSLVAGLYFPVDLLPGWIRWASDVQPLTPAVELFRWALVGQPLSDSAWPLVAKLALFAAVVLPLSIRALTIALRMSRQRGTILEY